MPTISVNRYDADASMTVYRDNHYCGHVFRPIDGYRWDYLASPWTADVPQRTFVSEQAAIDYLVREG